MSRDTNSRLYDIADTPFLPPSFVCGRTVGGGTTKDTSKRATGVLDALEWVEELESRIAADGGETVLPL